MNTRSPGDIAEISLLAKRFDNAISPGYTREALQKNIADYNSRDIGIEVEDYAIERSNGIIIQLECPAKTKACTSQ